MRDLDHHRLRRVRESDAPEILAAFSSAPDMARQGDVTDLATAQRQARWLRAENVHGVAIVDGADALIGVVGVQMDTANRSGWVYYWMHAAHRGQGLVARAAATVCDRSLAPAGEGGWALERLELGHRENNPSSGAVARAAGFVLEGREREKFLIDGERVDVLCYGRLPTDPPAPAYSPIAWIQGN